MIAFLTQDSSTVLFQAIQRKTTPQHFSKTI